MADELDSVENLRFLYEQEKKLNAKLEEECDLLAEENCRLREEIAQLRAMLPQSSESDHRPVSIAVEGESSPLPIARMEGDRLYANKASRQIFHACGDKNVLSVSFMSEPQASSNRDIVVCGGVDGKLSLYDSESLALLQQFTVGAPVLMISIRDLYIAASMMDGSVAIVSLASVYQYHE